MTRPRRVIGIAVSSLKVGFAYLIDGELMDWRLSIDASRTEEACFAKVDEWLSYYQPDVIVIEDPEYSRKGPNSLLLQSAVKKAAMESEVRIVEMPRGTDAANKYAEAEALAAEFPQIMAWLPERRRAWEQEPRNIILFEALALAWNWWRTSAPPNEEIIEW